MQPVRFFVAVIGALIFVTSDLFAQDQPKVYAIWGNPDNGRRVYAAKGCGRCHAINGVGPTIGPDLGQPAVRPQTITQLAGAMWNHAPEMRKLAQEKGVQWPVFQESELRDLIAYLYFLRMLDQPGNVPRGERLFDESTAPRATQWPAGEAASRQILAGGSNTARPFCGRKSCGAMRWRWKPRCASWGSRGRNSRTTRWAI